MALTSEKLIKRLADARYGPVTLDKSVVEQAFQTLCDVYKLGPLPVFWAVDPLEGYQMAVMRIFADLNESTISAKPHPVHLTGFLKLDAFRGILTLIVAYRFQLQRGSFHIEQQISNATATDLQVRADRLAEESAQSQLDERYGSLEDPRWWEACKEEATARAQAPWIVAGHGLLDDLTLQEARVIEQFLRAYEAGLGLYWVFADGIVAVPRPHLQVENNWFHCAHGPAICWPGGLSFWFWRGVQVTEEIVMHPETLTIETILATPNLEVMRVMMERFGPERMVKEGDPQMLHQSSEGTLYALQLPDEWEQQVIVEVVCPSTGRHYWLRVPPTMRQVREAIAWTFGLTAYEYQPSVET